MKALVKKYAKKGIWLDEVAKPTPKENEVLIKVHKTAICGTDIHIFEWNEWAQRTIPVPMIIGHEFVGEVVDIGRNVHDVTIGEMVSAEGHLVCGRCRNCRAGRFHLCPHTKGIGVNTSGAFAEYIAVPVHNIWHCTEHFPKEYFAIFDPFGNAVHTALSFPILGEDVLITGAGPIGIMAAMVTKQAGARHVVLTDVNPYRLALARQAGIAHAIDTRETPLEQIRAKLAMKEGFDLGLEMSGNGHALNELIANCCHGGKIAMLGMQARGTTVDWDTVVFNGLTIKGIYGREMFETWYKMTMLVELGLDLSKIITHRFRVDDYLEGFETMASGQSGKVILDWE